MATKEEIPTDLALEIGTNLGPQQFIKAARNFFGFVERLSLGIIDDVPIEWEVIAREGSTVLAMRPRSDALSGQIGTVYNRIQSTTQALVSGDANIADIDEKALEYAKALADLSREKGNVIPIRVWVKREPILYGPDVADTIRENRGSGYTDFGSFEGRLHAIQDASGTLELKIRDLLYAAPIKCIVAEEMLDEALDNFRRRVEVFGEISYRSNGMPISIAVSQIERLPDDEELPSAEDVRGILSGNAA